MAGDCYTPVNWPFHRTISALRSRISSTFCDEKALRGTRLRGVPVDLPWIDDDGQYVPEEHLPIKLGG